MKSERDELHCGMASFAVGALLGVLPFIAVALRALHHFRSPLG